MTNITVCVRFRPLSSKEKKLSGGTTCIQALDAESFIYEAEKEEEMDFCFDKVFYQESKQEDVYDFLVKPIVQDTLNAINGTVIIYGQTGAGKTYTMEGPGVSICDELNKGMLPRVVDGLFESIKSTNEVNAYIIKLSMVEIYMEKVRDLFDLSKDNLQIKEAKIQGIFLSGATEITILDPEEALECLARGIANRAVGETQMNTSSSRSHCIYIFLAQKECPTDGRLKTGKLMLVDLAGSEKVEKTGAEGKILDEAKSINKSLSALGNVINGLTTGKVNHIPYRDSKLTRVLQDTLGGNSQCALLCCCSPSSLNAPESLSTLRFGTRSKLLKAPVRVSSMVDTAEDKQAIPSPIENSSPEKITSSQVSMTTSVDITDEKQAVISSIQNKPTAKILEKLRDHLTAEDVNLLEELFILEGLLFDPQSAADLQSAYEDVVSQTVSQLLQAVEELRDEAEELRMENDTLKAELAVSMALNDEKASALYIRRLSNFISFLFMPVLIIYMLMREILSSWAYSCTSLLERTISF